MPDPGVLAEQRRGDYRWRVDTPQARRAAHDAAADAEVAGALLDALLERRAGQGRGQTSGAALGGVLAALNPFHGGRSSQRGFWDVSPGAFWDALLDGLDEFSDPVGLAMSVVPGGRGVRGGLNAAQAARRAERARKRASWADEEAAETAAEAAAVDPGSINSPMTKKLGSWNDAYRSGKPKEWDDLDNLAYDMQTGARRTADPARFPEDLETALSDWRQLSKHRGSEPYLSKNRGDYVSDEWLELLDPRNLDKMTDDELKKLLWRAKTENPAQGEYQVRGALRRRADDSTHNHYFDDIPGMEHWRGLRRGWG